MKQEIVAIRSKMMRVSPEFDKCVTEQLRILAADLDLLGIKKIKLTKINATRYIAHKLNGRLK